ncbi:hypothetical protein K402DRAFT_389527 [Aulographum hederae CBS 113979]|uniref:Nuclear RNA binding protein n=1 Tax=Aulographum hederae CBS 113979 TaxID=1176131 RepID=A0A6G1HC56_9PEZI|nr:hypothetical protein K402DRAFT_389527 [Aulographum hederae CBS 113979]
MAPGHYSRNTIRSQTPTPSQLNTDDMETTPDRQTGRESAASSRPVSATSINFSRKRAHNISGDGHSLEQSYARANENDEQDPKRLRFDEWPFDENVTARTRGPTRSPPPSVSRRYVSSPVRNSKFKEGSMHDRRSDKPPSMFIRHTSTNDGSMPSVDHLMEEYAQDANGNATVRLPGKQANRATQAKGLTHHPNMSISGPSVDEAAENDGNSPGLYRFGRSIASAFNPVNLWNKVSTNWGKPREEHLQERKDEKLQQMVDQKAKAEKVYAEMKAAGAFGANGSKALTNPAALAAFAEKMNAEPNDSNRDSGVHMEDGPKGSTNRGETSAAPSGSLRKSSFHIRTPSLSNLKKSRSEVNLHGRRSSTSSVSTQKPLPPHPGDMSTLRKQQSRKDMQKQQKLTKRVSDLEAKLESARRELHVAIGPQNNPLPPLPRTGMAEPSPSQTYSSKTMLKRRGFQPGTLPSLPSERLLFPDGVPPEMMEGAGIGPSKSKTSFTFANKIVHSTEDSDTSVHSPDVRDIDTFPMPPFASHATNNNAPNAVTKTSTLPPRSSSLQLKGPTESQDSTSEPTASGPEEVLAAKGSSTQKSSSKKREPRRAKYQADSWYQPIPDSESDEGWEIEQVENTGEKHRAGGGGDIGGGKANTTGGAAIEDGGTKGTSTEDKEKYKHSKANDELKLEDLVPEREGQETGSGAVEGVVSESERSGRLMSLEVPKDYSPTRKISASGALDLALHPIEETIYEENVSISTTTKTSKIPLAKSPKRSTAVATPSYPRRTAKTPSPSKPASRGRIPEQWRTPGRKSTSPPPSRGYSKGAKVGEDEIVEVRPDGVHVPPLPGKQSGTGQKKNKDGEFEWPEDCF